MSIAVHALSPVVVAVVVAVVVVVVADVVVAQIGLVAVKSRRTSLWRIANVV